MASREQFDVVVVGSGNAGLCAALTAREGGASVLLLEKAPEDWRGGNSFFTGGLFRFAFSSMDDIRSLIPDLSEEELKSIEIEPYDEDRFYNDMLRVTEYLTDGDLALTLIRQSLPTMQWLLTKGVRWNLAFGRQAFQVRKKFRFWGGAVVEVVGGGPGLVGSLFERANKEGVEIRYASKAIRLLPNEVGKVDGVRIQGPKALTRSAVGPLFWRREVLRQTRSGAVGTWVRTGTLPRCAALRTTPAMESRWPSTSVPSPSGTGARVMRSLGT